MTDTHLREAVDATARASSRIERLAARLGENGWSVATAESLTAGAIGTVLAAAPDAADWYRGSIVAYDAEVKFGLLGVPRGPVVTQECARRMAVATAGLLGADLCVSVTGVGGPDPEEGQPPGTVWLAVSSPTGVVTERRVFDGSPVEVVVATVEHALALVRRVARVD